MNFPTIFDWLERFAFLRGMPAVYLILLTAVIIVITWDWRPALLALITQYLVAGLLFVDVLDPRLAIVKPLNGLFICLILYLTGRQINAGRLPPASRPPEQARPLPFGMRLKGALPPPATRPSIPIPLRLLLTLIITLLLFTLGQRPEYRLPAIPDDLSHLNTAIYILAGLGLLGAGLNSEPLKAGLALLTFLTGFELFYSALDQSVTVLAALAAVDLIITLVIAYLAQAHHSPLTFTEPKQTSHPETEN